MCVFVKHAVETNKDSFILIAGLEEKQYFFVTVLFALAYTLIELEPMHAYIHILIT